jgi:hypothetical protein
MMAGVSSHPESASRPPPRIIRVPPPTQHSFDVILIIAAAILASIPAIVTWRVFPELAWVGVVWICIAWTGALLLIPCTRWRARHRESQRTDWIRRHEKDVAEPVSVGLQKEWRWYGYGLEAHGVHRVLAAHGHEPAAHAYVVCCGTFELPDIGDQRFEPRIITATEELWRKLFWIPIGLVALVWVLSAQLSGSPRRWFFPGGMYFLCLALSASATWFYQAWLCPKYYRLAPGMIQIIRFRQWRRGPEVISFPIVAGTLAVVTETGKNKISISLKRGQLARTIDLSTMRRRERVAVQFWDALLSTAPTPPLSDEELVG